MKRVAGAPAAARAQTQVQSEPVRMTEGWKQLPDWLQKLAADEQWQTHEKELAILQAAAGFTTLVQAQPDNALVDVAAWWSSNLQVGHRIMGRMLCRWYAVQAAAAEGRR